VAGEPRPLQPRQHQAAALLGRGASQGDVAEEVGVSRRTIADWMKRDDFRELVQTGRDAALDAAPTARATLEAALAAELPDGRPDWKTRVSAARALVGADGPGSKPEPVLPELTVTNPDLLDPEGPPAQAEPPEVLDFDAMPEPPDLAALHARLAGAEATPESAAEYDCLQLAEPGDGD
jgi:hypothetical protein